MLDPRLVKALDVKEGCNDDEARNALLALLVSATADEEPRLTLRQIFVLIGQTSSASLLDPLNMLPLLLPCSDSAAKDIVALLGECSPAKEVVMAAQEVVERIQGSLETEDNEDDVEDQRGTSTPSQLLTIVQLYASAIPRLKLRQKTSFETIEPLLLELRTVIELAGGRFSRDEGRDLITMVSHLVERVHSWTTTTVSTPEDQLSACKEMLRDTLEHTITAVSHCIKSSIGQRTFQICFPRLQVQSMVEDGWEGGERSIQAAIAVYHKIGGSTQDLHNDSSTSALILLAHRQPELVDAQMLSKIPIIMASLQTGSALDETLAILLRYLHRRKPSPSGDLSPEIIIPLSSILASIANAHPDPSIRHMTFRIISLLLSSTPPSLRLQILRDFTTDHDLAAMRVASVGLVKEAVLDAISPSAPRPNIFVSSKFLQAFAPVLFLPDPVNLFSLGLSVQDFQDSTEPSRLTECLGLIYILLIRDEGNLMGIRNPDNIAALEKGLLAPLRSTLEKWMNPEEATDGHMEVIMPFVSLKVSLERVDGAILSLQQVFR